MREYEITFRVRLDDDNAATDEEIRDWVRFELHEICQLRNSSVANMDLDAIAGSTYVRRIR